MSVVLVAAEVLKDGYLRFGHFVCASPLKQSRILGCPNNLVGVVAARLINYGGPVFLLNVAGNSGEHLNVALLRLWRSAELEVGAGRLGYTALLLVVAEQVSHLVGLYAFLPSRDLAVVDHVDEAELHPGNHIGLGELELSVLARARLRMGRQAPLAARAGRVARHGDRVGVVFARGGRAARRTVGLPCGLRLLRLLRRVDLRLAGELAVNTHRRVRG